MTLSGRFQPLLFVDQYAEVKIELPAGDSRKRFIEGPFQFNCEYKEKEFSVNLTIGESAFPSKNPGWYDGVSMICHDASGRDIKINTLSGRNLGGSFVGMQCKKLSGPATITIKYPCKGTMKSLPFEFKDVGLPRTGAPMKPEKNDF